MTIIRSGAIDKKPIVILASLLVMAMIVMAPTPAGLSVPPGNACSALWRLPY